MYTGKISGSAAKYFSNGIYPEWITQKLSPKDLMHDYMHPQIYSNKNNTNCKYKI